MLDRTKLIGEVQQLSESLFVSYAHEHTIAQQVWQRIVNDVTFEHKIKAAQVPWLLPSWSGKLDATFDVEKGVRAYRAISVDGSQIYPDRHQGTGCFLINIGTVAVSYGDAQSSVTFNSVPYVFNGMQGQEDVALSPEFVNCKRQEFEFSAGMRLMAELSKKPDGLTSIMLFDGSLVFWQLAAKDSPLKNIFLPLYFQSLQTLQANKNLFACYISLPKNRDISHLIRCALCDFDAEHSDAYALIDHLIDTTVARFFMEPYTRSTVFKVNHPLCNEYPPDLHPHFFYLHVGDEIARIEIPAWIAQDQKAVDSIAWYALDQSLKGRGYPVVLAEAHEQAVVKGPDRDFFYQLITKFGIEYKQHLSLSQKSLKKRGIGI